MPKSDVTLARISHGENRAAAAAYEEALNTGETFCASCLQVEDPDDSGLAYNIVLTLEDGLGPGDDEVSRFCSWECLTRYGAEVAIGGGDQSQPFVISGPPERA